MKTARAQAAYKQLLAKKKGLLFAEKVWQACKRVPKGKVATYGVIAKMIGKPLSSRAVGNALNRNPFAPDIPCHRVVRSDGSVGGFASGSSKKAKLLRAEGVEIRNDRVPLAEYLFSGK